MTAAELQSEDPDRLARRWSEVIERPVQVRDGQPEAVARSEGDHVLQGTGDCEA